MEKPPKVTYRKDWSDQLWWCNSHGRRATHICSGDEKRCCDPQLGGIMFPCSVVDLTGAVEIEAA